MIIRSVEKRATEPKRTPKSICVSRGDGSDAPRLPREGWEKMIGSLSHNVREVHDDE